LDVLRFNAVTAGQWGAPGLFGWRIGLNFLDCFLPHAASFFLAKKEERQYPGQWGARDLVSMIILICLDPG